MATGSSRTRRQGIPCERDPLAMLALVLVKKLPGLSDKDVSLVSNVLHEALDNADQNARALRLEMQTYLLQISDRLLAEACHQGTSNPETDPLLTTTQAVQLMHTSRPFVVMLIDRQRLPGAIVSEGGHRKVPRSSVIAWLEVNKEKIAGLKGPADYRKAAEEAGAYNIPDERYLEILGELDDEQSDGDA